jgi:hypothetical protein
VCGGGGEFLCIKKTQRKRKQRSKLSAELTCLSTLSIAASPSIRASIEDARFFFAATIKGVLAAMSFNGLFTSAPRAIKARTASFLPFSAATVSGVSRF